MSIKDDMEDVQEAVINELISDNGLNPLTVGDLQITTAKIADDAVTVAKLGSDVDLGQVNDGAVTPAKLSQSYLPLTGGTMTGALNVGGTVTADGLTAIVAGSTGDIATFGLSGNTNNPSLIVKGDATNQILTFRGGSNSSTYPAIAFDTGTGGEKLRIDPTGNVLLGKAATTFSSGGHVLWSDGLHDLTRAGKLIQCNRLSSDGEMIKLFKDGSPVGSIGTNSSAAYFVGTAHGLIMHTGDVRPCTNTGANDDNSLDLGASFARFDDIYATNGTIQTSDRNEKQDIEELSEAEQRVAVACKGLLRKFCWKSSVEENGAEARIHFGIIAQDLQAAFEAEGLDAGRYAMFISSTWTDEETEEEKTRLGVRYSELLAFIIAAI